MSSIEDLEGRWHATGAVADETALLSALLAAGQVESTRLLLAAALGQRAAQAVVNEIPELPRHYRSKIEVVVAALDGRKAVEFGLLCAERVLDSFECARPGDSRPRDALKILRRWLKEDVGHEVLEAFREGASQAGIEADDSHGRIPDERMRKAMDVAAAISNAMFAAQNFDHLAATGDALVSDGVNGSVAFAARFDVKAAGDPDTEAEWQRTKLIDMLLGRA